jgi:arylsulfatase A-like enzyme
VAGAHQGQGLRSQFCHVIDITPTIYEAANITLPTMLDGVEQKPIEGVSLVYDFDDAKAPTRHSVQYFELMGKRGRLDGKHHPTASATGARKQGSLRQPETVCFGTLFLRIPL